MKKGTGADAAAPEVTGFCIPYPGLSGGPAKEGHTKLHFEKDVGRGQRPSPPSPPPPSSVSQYASPWDSVFLSSHQQARHGSFETLLFPKQDNNSSSLLS